MKIDIEPSELREFIIKQFSQCVNKIIQSGINGDWGISIDFHSSIYFNEEILRKNIEKLLKLHQSIL